MQIRCKLGGSIRVLLRLALERLANHEQEDGTLAFRVRREELNWVIVEETQVSRAAYAARYLLPPMAPGSSWTAR
jgi:hypothetical protein